MEGKEPRNRNNPADEELAILQYASGDDPSFEQQLKLAMRQRPAPLGLKTRLLAQSKTHLRDRSLSPPGIAQQWGWRRIFRPMAQRVLASVMVAAVVGGFAVYRQREERRKGELARDQVLTAFRITSRTLDRVHNRLAPVER